MRESILIFSSKDDLNSGWERAQLLAAEGQKLGLPVRLINKSGFVLEDLHLVARYRVVSTPTILVLRDEEVAFRVVRLLTARQLSEALASLSKQGAPPSA